jgi:hypothetical protein
MMIHPPISTSCRLGWFVLHSADAACCGRAQIAFLQQLMADGLEQSTDVVFLDMDILVVDSLAEVLLSPVQLNCIFVRKVPERRGHLRNAACRPATLLLSASHVDALYPGFS